MPSALTRRVSAGVVAFALAAAGTLVASPALAAVTTDPVPLTPTAGTVTADRTPEFGWQAGDGTHWSFRHRVEVLSGSTPVRYGILQGDTSWSPLIPLPDGEYSWRVAGVEGINDLGAWSAAVPFAVDTVAPDVTLVSPSTGLFSGAGVEVSGTIADLHPGTWQIELDGVVVATGTGSTFAATLHPTTGSHSIVVRAVDVAGNSDAGSTTSVAIEVDAEAPSLALTSPVDGSFVRPGPNVRFIASVQATGTQADLVLNVDGAPIHATSTTTTKDVNRPVATGSWTDGSTHVFEAVATDQVAQSTVLSATVTVDGSDPVVGIDAPARFDTLVGTVQVSGTATDAGSGVAGVELRIRPYDATSNSCSAPVATYAATLGPAGEWTASFDSAGLADGGYCLQARATDGVGNAANDQVKHVTVDNTAPAGSLAGTYPSGWHLSVDHFAWTALSDPSGVTYELALGRHPNVDANGLMTQVDWIETGLASTTFDVEVPTGPHFYQVRAVDGAGNATAWTAPRGFQVIGVPEVVAPTQGAEFSASTIVAEWTPVYGVGGVDYYEIEYGLDRDHDGTLSPEYRTVDGTGWNGGANVTRTQSFPTGASLPTGYEGPLSIRVRAVYNIPLGGSTVGPWSTPIVNYLRDTGAPTVTIDAPIDGTATKSSSVDVTVTATDAAGLDRLTAALWNGDNTAFLQVIGVADPLPGPLSATRTWSLDTSALPEGEYTIRGVARDIAGKWQTTTSRLTIDRTAPTVSIDAPGDGLVVGADTVDVTVTATDAVGLGRVTAALWNGDNSAFLQVIGVADPLPGPTSSSQTWTLDTSGLPDGDYTIRGVARDLAGSWQTTTARFTLDTTAPLAPQPINPENGRMQASDSPVLDWQPLADAASYEVRTSRSPGRTPNVNDGELNGADAATVAVATDELALSGLADGWLWWQVRAIDAVGNVGPWSNIWATGVDTTAPVVSLTSPVDGAILTSGDFTLQWTAPESGLTYDVRSSIDAATDPVSGELLGTTGGGQTTTTVNELALAGVPEQTYHWQVRATDAVGNVGPWTAPWSVTVDLPTLAVPPSGTPGGTTGGPGPDGTDEPTDLTTFALTEEPDEPADDEENDGGSGSDGGTAGADPQSTSATDPVDTGMIALLVGLAAGMLLFLLVFLAWLRRRQAA